MPARSVFLIGPGFIGGEILDNLLKEKDYEITALVRREAAAAELAKTGVKTVIGTLDDKAIIQKQVAASDVVFHTATADHLLSVQSVLDGIDERASDGQSTIYIHTSGTGVIGDKAAGEYQSDVVFHDDKPGDIDALPDTAPHRGIDLTIVGARKRLGTKAKIAIMLPPCIYGVSTREKRLSIQLPTLVRYSLKHGYAGRIGKGATVWSQVHVADLARAYLTLLHWLEQTPAEETLQNPYFFCESGEELSWNECAVEYGKALHKAGRISTPEPKTIPPENYRDLFGSHSPGTVGSNSRSRANRLRKLGWRPREKHSLRCLVEDEIPLILKETGNFSGYAGTVGS